MGASLALVEAEGWLLAAVGGVAGLALDAGVAGDAVPPAGIAAAVGCAAPAMPALGSAEAAEPSTVTLILRLTVMPRLF